MSMMCPLNGCKAKKGMCIHEKLMAMMGVVVLAAGGAHWGLGLF